jgi:hypothetical protein
MSIKTTKRLALGVIASLVFAPFAAIAPASAVVPTLFKIVTAESIGTDTDTATTVAGASNYVQIESKVDSGANTTVRVDVTGGEFVDITELVAGAAGNGTTTAPAATISYNTAKTSASSSSNDIFGASTDDGTPGVLQLRIATPTAGTLSIKVYSVTDPASNNGVATSTLVDTLTVTVNSAATAGVLSVADSTSILDADALATAHDATTDATVSVARAATTYAGVVKITLKDVNKVLMPNTTSVSATVSGPGTVALNTTQGSATYATSGRAVSATTLSGVVFAAIYADGTAGVGTVTFSVGTTVVATETVTFYGAAATYTATVVQGAVTANGTATTDAILVAAKDAAGVAVPGHTIYAFSSDTTKATVEASDATEATAIATSGARPASLVAATPVGSVAFDVTGIATKSGAVTITFGNATTLAASTITTTASVIVSELKANSVVLTTDKATYLPGELVTLTLTAKDKNGNPIADGLGTALLTGALTSSQSITSTLFDANVATKTGVATATFYAPLVEGTVVLSGKVGVAGTYVETLYADTAITLSIPVAKPVVPVVVPPVVYDKPTLSFVKNAGRIILSGTAVDGEGDIIIYTKKVGTTAWKERAKTLEVAAPGDFNGSILALKSNVLIRVKQEGTGLFSNQIIVVK